MSFSMLIYTNGPNYFFPYAQEYVTITNPYAKLMNNYYAYASTNNQTWVQVGIRDSGTQALTPNKVGIIPLDTFTTTISYNIQYQNQNVTDKVIHIVNPSPNSPSTLIIPMSFEEAIMNHTTYLIEIKPIPNAQTWIITVSLFILFWSFLLQIFDFASKRDKEKFDSLKKILQPFRLLAMIFN